MHAKQLYDACHRRLQLTWLGPVKHHSRPIHAPGDQGYPLIAHFNLIHSHPIQVLDPAVLHYFDTLKKNSLNDAIERLCSPPTAIILISEGMDAPAWLSDSATLQGIVLLGSPLSSEKLIAEISYFLSNELANSQVIHGVFMEVMGIGVLLRGDSGIGKSELALELINRGQRLIADDAPIFRRLSPETLIGHCPHVLQDYLEVRGLGLLNIRALFGDSAVKQEMPLQLIVHLQHIAPGSEQQLDRLNGSREVYTCLDVPINQVTIPVAPGRNLAVLVEAAARNHILYTNGQDPLQAFTQRQQQMMHNDIS